MLAPAGTGGGMEINRLIAEHGTWFYAIAFIWTILEGETVVLIAGFAPAQGLLNPFLLLAATGLGSFAGDQSCFWIGCRFGSRLFLAGSLKRLAARGRGRPALAGALQHRFHLVFPFHLRSPQLLRFRDGDERHSRKALPGAEFSRGRAVGGGLHRRRLFSRPCTSRRTRRRGPLVQFGDVGRVRHDRQRDRARAPAPTAASAQDTARD